MSEFRFSVENDAVYSEFNLLKDGWQFHVAFRTEQKVVAINEFDGDTWKREVRQEVAGVSGAYLLKLSPQGGVAELKGGQGCDLRYRPHHAYGQSSEIKTVGPVALLPGARKPMSSRESREAIRELIDAAFDEDAEAALWLVDFDAEAYVNLNPDIDIAPGDRVGAVEHFLQTGMKEGRPISISQRFDADFFCSFYPELEDTAAAYRHWIVSGHAQGLFPNAAAALERFGLRRLPEGFDARAFRAAAGLDPATLGCTSPVRAFLSWAEAVEQGGRLRHLDCFHDSDALAGMLLDFGRAQKALGNGALALECLEHGVWLRPEDPVFWQHLGDLHARHENDLAASRAYRRAISLAGAGADALAPEQLATCLTRLGETGEALEILAEAGKAAPPPTGPQEALNEARKAHFARLRNAAIHHVFEGDPERALELVKGYRDALVTLDHERLESRPRPRILDADEKPRVIILGNTSFRQCTHYRIEQKIEHLETAGYAVTFVPATEPAEFLREVAQHDIAIFYRLAATPEIVDCIEAARRAGLVTFYEIDDLVFDDTLFPPPIENYCGALSPFSHAELLVDTPLYVMAMGLCDYGIASTPSLCTRIAPLVRRGECFLHRNAFDTRHERFALHHDPERPKPFTSEDVCIFYGSGTLAHGEDVELLLTDALAQLLEEHADVRLFLVGQVPVSEKLAPFAERIERFPNIWEKEHYWALLAQMDINLAVLLDTPFNDAKSEIKWLEAAMVGVPSIVSPTATYREILTDGENAMFAADAEAWFARLEDLVTDAELRRRMGRAAHRLATEAYGLETSARNIDEVLQQVWSREAPARPPAEARKPLLLLVNTSFEPTACDEAARVFRSDVDTLLDSCADAFDLQVFCGREGAGAPHVETAFGYRGARVTAVSEPPREPLGSATRDPKMGEIFNDLLARVRPDLVHFHCLRGLTGSVVEATRKRAIPYLVTAHDAWWLSEHRFLTDAHGHTIDETSLDIGRALRSGDAGAIRQATRWVELEPELRGARMILASSEEGAAIYRRFGVENVTAFANAATGQIDRQGHDPSAEGRLRFGILGGREAQAGLPLVEAALLSRPFENLSLTVVDPSLPRGGRGRPELWRQTPVAFVGEPPADRIGALLNRIDVLLVPSAWPDALGTLTRQALESGLWVVVSDRHALRDAVTPGETGFVVDLSTTRGLVAALEEMDADPARFRSRTDPAAAPPPVEDRAERLAGIYRHLLQAAAGS
ncbi:MAG: glycosyltransferase [Roseovarius sp.]